MNHQYYTCKYR